MMLLNPYRFASGGGGGGITTAGLVLTLDAGDSSSYGGSGQTWANTVSAPADGSTQAANDFYLGATSSSEGSDPTFTGTAGSGSAYWAFDGGDYFTFAAGSASTAFLKAMHKAGAKFTLEAWVYHPGTTGSNVNPVFSSGCSDQGGPDVSRGIVFADFGTLNTTSGKRNCIRVKRDGGGANALSVESGSDLSVGWHMLACSIDGSGAQNSFLYTDGGYDPVGGNNTWNGTFSSPGSTDPANPPRIGDRGDGGFRLPSGSRAAIFRIYNTNLAKADLDANWSAVRSRYGL